MSNRASFSTLLLTALFAWVGLLLFTNFVPPVNALSFVIFFLILTIAITCTSAPIAYLIGRWLISPRRYRPSPRHAIRQGALFALVIVFNLLLRALHSWNIFAALAICGAAVVIEILVLARK